jgi:hypothetical protein
VASLTTSEEERVEANLDQVLAELRELRAEVTRLRANG